MRRVVLELLLPGVKPFEDIDVLVRVYHNKDWQAKFSTTVLSDKAEKE
jgi:hypothetical protein